MKTRLVGQHVSTTIIDLKTGKLRKMKR